MARLFPARLVGAVSPEVAKIVQSLKRIPGEELLVWVRLPLGGSWRPALMLLDAQKSCHLFAVSSLTESRADAILQQDLFAATEPAVPPSEFERGEREQLLAFI